MYHALSVAQFIIDYCNEKNRGITNLKLQKILYFVQAEFLVSSPMHSPCFSDTIEAWDFGPVVPAVYHHYKIYGNAIIPSDVNDVLRLSCERISGDDRVMIESMVNQLAKYTASQLVQFTHAQEPWKKAYIRGYNNPISNESIRHFFEDQ